MLWTSSYIEALLFSANHSTMAANSTITILSRSSRIRSPGSPGISGLMTFSVKIAVGASRAPLADDRMAEISAPKNITWANSGALESTSSGRIIWESESIRRATISGSISVAE